LGSLTAVSDYNKTVPNYFDVNAHLGYKYNERFTAFLRQIILQIKRIKNG